MVFAGVGFLSERVAAVLGAMVSFRGAVAALGAVFSFEGATAVAAV